MTPQSSLSALHNGQSELKIAGRFTHPHWMAFLFSGLSAAGVSIISGRAVQNETQWDARCILDFSGSNTAPEALDFVMLALQRPESSVSSAKSPILSQFQIARRADQSLEVWLHGPDQIGFLGRVLSRLSLIMLFPIEIEINTVAGQIRDYIVFRGIGGMAPNDDAKKSLEILLKSCVK
jgi:hypothetical protein